MTVSLVGRATPFEDPQRLGLGRQQYSFEIFRADEVALTSTRFSGGDWRWRLVDTQRNILAAAGGYANERSCRKAVSHLRRFSSSAKLLDEAERCGIAFARAIAAPEPEPEADSVIVPKNPLVMV